MKVLAACLAAAVTGVLVGFALPTSPAPSTERLTTPEERCVATIVAKHWSAGDLCDTLPPAVKVNERKWNHYNRIAGWEWIGRNPFNKISRPESGSCWQTGATTDRDFLICYDGTIMALEG